MNGCSIAARTKKILKTVFCLDYGSETPESASSTRTWQVFGFDRIINPPFDYLHFLCVSNNVFHSVFYL